MNKQLRLLFVVNAINVLSDHLFIPLFALFVTGTGGGVELAGVIYGLGRIAHIAGGLVVLKIKDNKMLEFNSLLIGYVVKFLAWGALALYQNIAVLIVGQVVIGFTAAFATAAFGAYAAEHLDNYKHMSEYSFYSILESIAVAVAGISSGFIVANLGFSGLFTAMAVLELVAASVWLAVGRNRPTKLRGRKT